MRRVFTPSRILSAQKVFFDVTVGAGKPVQRINFELFEETVPKTAENFRALW
jgi:hypothetical protein